MVEHNLAKVGVASSNLVSRSIIFLLLLFIPVLSYPRQNIIIKQKYCIKNSVLTLKDIFPKTNKDIVLLSISNALSTYKIPSIDIISKIKRYISMPIEDSSGGVVTLDKQCDVRYYKKEIKKALVNVFKKRYNDIKIAKLSISPINSFPNDFGDYTFDKISVKEYNLRKKDGTFVVIYKNAKARELRIFFRYTILAKIFLFKAKHNIRSGKILFRNDFEKKESVFGKIPLKIVKDLKSGAYRAKNYIRKGAVITKYMIKKITLVRKKDMLLSVIKDGNLQIEFYSKALQDGNMGDIIKTVGNNGKIYKAKIIGKGLVVIQ